MPRPHRFALAFAWLSAMSLPHLTVAGDRPSPSASSSASAEEIAADETPRVTAQAAQERARLIHDIYVATLDTMHHRYFHGDRAVVPARAMEDVFTELERQHHIQARWISASFSPMSIDHEPKTDFEKQAARKLARGQSAVETIEEGYYRRVGAIALGNGCISCHSGLFATTSPTPKFAGLIISIPVVTSAVLEPTSTADTP